MINRVFYLHFCLALILILLAFLSLQSLSRESTVPLQTNLQALPLRIGAWEGAEEQLASEVVTVLGLHDWTLRHYRHRSGALVWLYIGFLKHFELLSRGSHHSPQICYPSNGWEPIQKGFQRIRLPEGKHILINKLLVQKGLEKRLVLYWYQMGEKIMTEKNVGGWGGYRLKLDWLLRLPSLLATNKRTDRALVRFSAPVVNSVDETLSHEIAFVQSVFPLLAKQFAVDTSSL